VAESLRRKVAGESMTSFREQDRRIDIVTRVAESNVDTLTEVLDLVVAQRQGRPVTVRDLVSSVEEAEGPAEIRRINHRRAAVVSANPTGLDLARTVAAIQMETASIDLPEGFRMSIGGQVREMDRSLSSLLFALALATFLVYVVMASLFEHLVQPLVIMVTLPLALVGVIGALAATGTNLSVLVFIGLIVLAGIVVNNAIVLIDYANQLRRERGMPLLEAVKEAGRVRLRPILMTATTTVVALVPTALGIGEGAELRAPLAITVIGGLISATLLTLLVIPVVYSMAEDLVARVRGRKERTP
jgi:HAE1 family hydrophobic/amphiphilic exporter-1